MGAAISYAELDRLTRDFAAYLQYGLGLPRGARVALMMPNLLQYPVALFGALRAGYTVVNFNPLYTPRELEHQLNDSGAEAIVILENFAHVLEKCIAEDRDRAHRDHRRVGDHAGRSQGHAGQFRRQHRQAAGAGLALPGAVAFTHALARRRAARSSRDADDRTGRSSPSCNIPAAPPACPRARC